MAQNNITVPNGSGLDVRTGFNNAILSLLTSFSGATDPSTLSPSCAVNFMKWIDIANKLVKTRNASNDAWLTKGALLDDGSEINYETVSTLASAATVNIGAANTNTVNITGTTTITAFDTAPAGVKRTLVFKDALTVTYAASAIILPTGANITVAAGDIMEFISEGSGVWRCTNYVPYNIGTFIVSMLGKQTLDALGVKYLMDQNGYICFGSLFGGLILQWGMSNITNNSGIVVTMPLAYTNTGYKVFTSHDNGVTATSVVPLSVGHITETYFYASNNTNENPAFFWMTIGN
jgi:hypothetical protein